MALLPAAITIVAVALIGGALSLAAFFWAIRTKQFSVRHMNEGALVVFDSPDDVGTPSDQMFDNTSARTYDRTRRRNTSTSKGRDIVG